MCRYKKQTAGTVDKEHAREEMGKWIADYLDGGLSRTCVCSHVRMFTCRRLP